MTLPRQAEHILALLNGLGFRQAHLVGQDLGGGIAQILAVRHPERVLSVTIMDGVCFSNWPVAPVVEVRYPTGPEYEPSADLAFRILRQGVHRPEMLTPDVVQGGIGPWAEPDGPERLRWAALALEQPFWGWRLSQAIPHARLHVLMDCGHYGMLDQPLLVARHLREHLAEAAGVQAVRPEVSPAAAAPQEPTSPPPV